MVGVRDKGLRMEKVASDELPKRHCKIDSQADSGNTDTGIVLICGRKVDIAVMMMVMAMGTMTSRLNCHDWE